MKGKEMRYIVIYGIACIDEIENRKETVTEIPAVTADEEKIKRLVEMCNKNDLSPCHLKEVTEDLLDLI